MSTCNPHVCPVELAGGLDNRVRRWLQKPERILTPFVREGMVALDLGCGPGFFTVPMAHMVGATGKVIACDLQAGMLEKVRSKIHGTALESRVHLCQCQEDSLGITDHVDFVLAFYMMHEVADQGRLLAEVARVLRPVGQMLVVEPPLHVSKSAFDQLLNIARAIGFDVLPGPKLWPNKTAVLRRSNA